MIGSERPGEEDYLWLMKVAKACLLMPVNTHIPLDSDGWESVAGLDAVYGSLGHPAVKSAWDKAPNALPFVGEALQTTGATHGLSVQYGQLGQHIVRLHKGPSRDVAARFGAALKSLSKDANKACQLADPGRIENRIDALYV